MPADDLVTQKFLIELLGRMEERVDGGHGRVRESLKEIKLDMRLGFEKIDNRLQTYEDRVARHSEEIHVIQAERAVEKEADRTRKQDHRDRTVLITTLTSMTITVGLFLIKAIIDHWAIR